MKFCPTFDTEQKNVYNHFLLMDKF